MIATALISLMAAWHPLAPYRASLTTVEGEQVSAPGPVRGMPAVPAYYVAPFGSDADNGSAARPFATLERARIEMGCSTTRTTYVLGGTYVFGATLVLSAPDSGMSFIVATEESTTLDGTGAGLGTLVAIEGANHVLLRGFVLAGAREDAAISITGGFGNRIVANSIGGAEIGVLLTGSGDNQVLNNSIVDSRQSGIEAKDGSDRNLFASNSIDGTDAPGQQGGGFFLHGASGNVIANNLVQNTAGVGISIANWDDTTINVGNAVHWNVVRNTSTRSQDSGAIYLLGRSHVDMQTSVTGNLVDGTGAGGDAHTIGIYLDDSTSGTTVAGNVVRNIGTHAVQVHGGDDNAIHHNLFDLGATATSAVLFQAAPADTNPTNTMLGNSVTANVVLASGSGQTAYSNLDGGTPVISGNLYHGLSAGQVADGAVRDVAPVFGHPERAAALIGFVEPDLSCAGPQALSPSLSLSALSLSAALSEPCRHYGPPLEPSSVFGILSGSGPRMSSWLRRMMP